MDNPILTKLPPHNIEFERSILSTVLVDPESIHEVSLSGTDFYKPSHSIIFDAMLQIKGSGKDIDILVVVDFLKAAGNLEKVGGATALSRLMDWPLSGNIEHYCEKIKEKANLRELIKISGNVINNCYDPAGVPVDIIEKAQLQITGIGSGETGLTDIKSLIEENMNYLEELRKNKGMLSGIPPGFNMLNSFTSGLQNTDLILLGARPSMGKTSLAMNIAREAAFNFYPTLVFSLEMSKEQVLNRLISDIGEVNGMKFKSGLFSDSDWKKINKANSRLFDMPIHIVDNSGLSIQQMLSIARNFKRKHNIGLIILDYVQLTKGWNENGQGPKSEISRSLKLMAKSLNVPVVALSQLNRSLESRTNKRPVMSDLREAGALEQDADVIAFLYRDEVYNKANEDGSDNKGTAELLIRKNRNGQVGMIPLLFIPEYTKFKDKQQF